VVSGHAQIGELGLLVRRVDTRESEQLARARAGVQPFGIPLLADLERRVDPHLEER
jgi:hypothetical protein